MAAPIARPSPTPIARRSSRRTGSPCWTPPQRIVRCSYPFHAVRSGRCTWPRTTPNESTGWCSSHPLSRWDPSPNEHMRCGTSPSRATNTQAGTSGTVTTGWSTTRSSSSSSSRSASRSPTRPSSARTASAGGSRRMPRRWSRPSSPSATCRIMSFRTALRRSPTPAFRRWTRFPTRSAWNRTS